MRAISLIVVHCSATREDKSFTEHDLDVCHRRRGFNGVGYHFLYSQEWGHQIDPSSRTHRCARPWLQQ